jgi:hypothetical protein
MNTSETLNKIAPALLRAQRAITFAIKDSKNPAFRSTYADLSSVIEACKPALNDAGIAFMQMPCPSEPGTIALTTRLLHESGEWIESTATCPLQKVDPQGYGSANTYLRRYSLAAAVGLYQDDDDGNAASKRGEGQPANAVRQDMTPQGRAKRIVAGVAAGDAAGAAIAMSGWEKPLLDEVWRHLDAITQDKLTAAWPVSEAA